MARKQWRLVKNTVPLENGEYLCAINLPGKGKHYFISTYSIEAGFSFDVTMKEKRLEQRVVAWLPIPKLS